jgi:hypothetical protein
MYCVSRLHYNTYRYVKADNLQSCLFGLFSHNIELKPDVTRVKYFSSRQNVTQMVKIAR